MPAAATLEPCFFLRGLAVGTKARPRHDLEPPHGDGFIALFAVAKPVRIFLHPHERRIDLLQPLSSLAIAVGSNDLIHLGQWRGVFIGFLDDLLLHFGENLEVSFGRQRDAASEQELLQLLALCGLHWDAAMMASSGHLVIPDGRAQLVPEYVCAIVPPLRA